MVPSFCRGSVWPPRPPARRRFVALIQLSLGRLLLSRACFCFTGQIGLFPVSVSARLYREQELGSRDSSLGSGGAVASFSTPSLSLSTERVQGLTYGRGAKTTTLAQLLHGQGVVDLTQSLEHALLRGEGRRGVLGWPGGRINGGQSQGRILLSELHGDGVQGRSGPVFDR
jgi:hypothetical protein